MIRARRKRWLVFQVISLFIAAASLAATWDQERSLHAQEWLVPLWIVMTPLILKSAFDSAPAVVESRDRIARERILIAGMALVQLVNVGLVLAGQVPWRWITLVLVLAGAIQAKALILIIRMTRQSQKEQ